MASQNAMGKPGDIRIGKLPSCFSMVSNGFLLKRLPGISRHRTEQSYTSKNMTFLYIPIIQEIISGCPELYLNLGHLAYRRHMVIHSVSLCTVLLSIRISIIPDPCIKLVSYPD
jgi:hypothetical protein